YSIMFIFYLFSSFSAVFAGCKGNSWKEGEVYRGNRYETKCIGTKREITGCVEPSTHKVVKIGEKSLVSTNGKTATYFECVKGENEIVGRTLAESIGRRKREISTKKTKCMGQYAEGVQWIVKKRYVYECSADPIGNLRSIIVSCFSEKIGQRIALGETVIHKYGTEKCIERSKGVVALKFQRKETLDPMLPR
ncbi:hypothetical protein PFISCL1PPCAC_14712, partial [Pristionchus fissidentatus]